MTDVLSLHYGAVFKQAFSNPTVFHSFVRDVTGVSVNVQRIHTEYEYPERVGNINVKYDLFAEDTEQRIIIEIQHMKEEDFFPRFLYYHMLGIMQQATSHDEYEPAKTVYTIVVLTSVPRDSSITFSWGRHLTELLDEYGDRHIFAPHQLIFLTPRLVNENTPAAVKPWLEVIADSLDKELDENDYPDPSIKELISEILRSTMSAEVSTAIKDESAWEKAKARFRREARQDGLKEGLKTGRQEGRQEGLEQGRRQQQEMTARVMMEQGIHISIISTATGLSESEIEALS
ncbi:MAG: PD-(D/E)XK nuclease family transposase [Chloroflexota bacterium]